MSDFGVSEGMASIKASKISAKAARYAANLQYEQYQQTRQDLMPWLKAGGTALNQLTQKIEAGPGEYEKSPYYDFLMEQGTQALERGAAAKGGVLGGAQQKALTKFGQGIASTDYNTWLANWYNSLTPLQSLAGVGQTTGTQLGTLGAYSAAKQGEYITQAGQAEAAGVLGAGKAMSYGMNYLGNLYGNVLGGGGIGGSMGGRSLWL